MTWEARERKPKQREYEGTKEGDEQASVRGNQKKRKLPCGIGSSGVGLRSLPIRVELRPSQDAWLRKVRYSA